MNTAHGPATIPFVLNKNYPKYPSWDEMFKELVHFKKINGHLNVVVRSGLLGKWVNSQRYQYRSLKRGKYSPVTIYRRELLESIGFAVICQPSTPPWEQRFQELVGFKKINGHVNVPQRHGPLGKWVSHQRTQYHRLQEGRQSLMTNERREKLDIIGFDFCGRTGPPWDQRFQELLDFKKKHGHTNVPTSSRPLRNWVVTQRYQYRLLKEGKYSPLTSGDRLKRLESIGFSFMFYENNEHSIRLIKACAIPMQFSQRGNGELLEKDT
jgi:hypothetical protein